MEALQQERSETGNPEVFCNFPQFLQVNAGVVPKINPHSLLPRPFRSLFISHSIILSSMLYALFNDHIIYCNKYEKKPMTSRGYKTD